MEKLIEVIKLVADKYMDKINLSISKNILILEYITYKEGKKDIYKKLQVEEVRGKLKIKFIPEEIIKITDLKGLENIILIISKQSQCKNYTSKEIEYIQKKYTVGTKVKLIKMYDFYSDIAEGEEGVITAVDDLGTIHVNWSNGSTLGLVFGIDEFEIIEEKICPKCGKYIEDYPAISRVDNKTKICSVCGAKEALETLKKYQGEVKNEK